MDQFFPHLCFTPQINSIKHVQADWSSEIFIDLFPFWTKLSCTWQNILALLMGILFFSSYEYETIFYKM